MFKNFKVIAHMRTPIATIDNIILDSILSAAKAKEIFKEEYYNGDNKHGTEEETINALSGFLDRKYGVFCTSIGIGDNRESISSWSSRWNEKDEDLVRFQGRGKKRIDVGSGRYKNYHMPLVTRAYKTITFYVRGDMEEVERLLTSYIHYLGKKGSQGYGQVNRWRFIEIDEDYSIIKDDKVMRPVPADEIDVELTPDIEIRQHPTTPPYWRNERELCIMPGVIKCV